MKKCIISFILGGIICSFITAYATESILGTNVNYDNSKSGLASTDIQNAVDDSGVSAGRVGYIVKPTATYTYPSGSTGGNVDVTNYAVVNASNVYQKGKEDGSLQSNISFNEIYNYAGTNHSVNVDKNKKYLLHTFIRSSSINVNEAHYSSFTGGNATLIGNGAITSGSAQSSLYLITTTDSTITFSFAKANYAWIYELG